MAYAVASDVTIRLPYWTFSVSSKPSTTNVTAWIAEGEAMLRGAMAAAGITAPSTSAVCGKWVCDYAEGRVRVAYAKAGGDGTNVDGQSLLDAFDALLQAIVGNPIQYAAMITGTVRGPRMSSYATANTDGLSPEAGDFDPTFKISEPVF